MNQRILDSLSNPSPNGSSALTTALLVLLLLAVELLPTLPTYFGVVTSMALGTALAAAVLLVVCLLRDAIAARLRPELPAIVTMNAVLVPMIVAAAVTVHVIFADYIERIDLARFASSLALLVLVMSSSIALGTAIGRSRPTSVDAAVRACFSVFCVIVILKFADLQPSQVFAKSFFPFTETSHFALAFGPLLMYRCVRADPRARLAWLSAAILVALIVQSLALVVICLLTAFTNRRIVAIAGISALGAVALAGSTAMPFGVEYFTERVDFSGEVMNLSNLVYLQGWEQLIESLTLSHGWGVGFQQFGVHGSETAATQAVRVLMQGADLNLQDGSFVLAKLGGELGVAGIALALAFVWTAARAVLALRRSASDPITTFARCVVVSYVADMFIRGTGYFSESTMLLIVALATLRVSQSIPALAGTQQRSRQRAAPHLAAS